MSTFSVPSRRFVCLWPSLLAAAVLLQPQVTLAQKSDPTDPPQGLFSDEWMTVAMAGQKAGYVHSTMSRSGDRITTRSLMSFSLARDQTPIEVNVMESTVESVTGAPLEFDNTQTVATTTATTVRGRISDGQVALDTSQYGMTQTKRIPYPTGALMTWGLFREQVRRGLTEGLSYEVDTYVPSMRSDQAIKTRITVGGPETIELDGKNTSCVRVTTTLLGPAPIETVGWVTGDWTVLKVQVQMMGTMIEMVRCDKQTALKDFAPPELFLSTLVKSDKRIDRQAARRIRYRLRATDGGEPLPDLPTTGMQTVKRLADGSIELEVTRQDHEPLIGVMMASESVELAEYLESNVWINIDDPDIATMAKKATRAAKSFYDIAHHNRQYVTKVITNKNLNVGFATASEVCRNLEGDCSEHAVLLAALGRASKLHSRVVLGLVYVPQLGGSSDVFGFHMWTQFHLAGQWVDFDAAQRESRCNPTHIAVAISSLRDAALADMAFSLANIIGRLEIEVLEADPPSSLANGGAPAAGKGGGDQPG